VDSLGRVIFSASDTPLLLILVLAFSPYLAKSPYF